MGEAKMRVDAMAGFAAPPFHPILTVPVMGPPSRCSGPQCV
jgi:hypothetical protein